jgi:rRNA maturation endonuclease Nob1
MPRIIYKFKNKERLNEAVGYLAAKQADIKMHDVPSVNEFKLEIECRAEQVEEIRSNIKSLNESYKLTETTSKIIKMLSETAKGTGRTIRLMDGDVIRLTPEHANVVILTHDELSEENQVALRTMVIESRKTHEAAIQFCLDQIKETE